MANPNKEKHYSEEHHLLHTPTIYGSIILRHAHSSVNTEEIHMAYSHHVLPSINQSHKIQVRSCIQYTLHTLLHTKNRLIRTITLVHTTNNSTNITAS